MSRSGIESKVKELVRDTEYATELATAEIDGCRIEPLFVKEPGQEEIRFSWWVEGRLANRPLDLPERQLLPLLRQAIQQRVFTDDFLRDLHAVLYDERHPPAD
jgi:hypothetical protein